MQEILPPPIAILRDYEGNAMPSCRVAVNARLLDTESVGAVLSGQLGPSSCCRQPDCPPLACCDCANPSCALCMMPNSSGAVVWSGLRIDVGGTFRIVFFANEPVRGGRPTLQTLLRCNQSASSRAGLLSGPCRSADRNCRPKTDRSQQHAEQHAPRARARGRMSA